MRVDLLVVGGGPAGLAAARGYRDEGGTGPVLIVSADTAAPYNRPPLSKDYLRGESDERDLPLAGPDEYAERGIELRTGCAVTNAAGGSRSWANAPGFRSEIGDRTLKYAAWGDGYDRARFVDHGGGAFTVWYETGGVVVGVATHEADDDYERGQQLVEEGGRL